MQDIRNNDPFCNFTHDVVEMFHRAQSICNIELETENENPKYMHCRDLTQYIRAKLMSRLNRASLSQNDIDICNKIVKGFFLHDKIYLYFRKTGAPMKIGMAIRDEPKTIRELRLSFESYRDNPDSTPLEPLFRGIRAQLAAAGMDWPVTHLYPLRADYFLRSHKIGEIYFSDLKNGRITKTMSLSELRRMTRTEPEQTESRLTLRRRDRGDTKEA